MSIAKPISPVPQISIRANMVCLSSMMLWAIGFPAAEVLMESWDPIALSSARHVIGVSAIVLYWLVTEGWKPIYHAPWLRGLGIGAIGFGFGSMLLLLGQWLSDPVTAAIAMAMMPVAGAVLENILDRRRMTFPLIGAIALVLLGGYIATGVKLTDGSFGLGGLLCLIAVVNFAWGTRATTRDLPELSLVGKTSVTFIGAMALVFVAHAVVAATGILGAQVGLLGTKQIVLLLFFALISMVYAQFLWIKGADQLGVFLASFHMNAVPFYVMVVVVLFLGEKWNWNQAGGAVLVGIGVMLSQVYDARSTQEIRP